MNLQEKLLRRTFKKDFQEKLASKSFENECSIRRCAPAGNVLPLLSRKAVQVVAQPLLDVILRMSDDSDGPRVAGIANGLQQRNVELAFAQRQNLLPLLLAVASHPVQIQAQQVRLHQPQDIREIVDVFREHGVVVVDDAHAIGDCGARAEYSHTATRFAGSPCQPPWLYSPSMLPSFRVRSTTGSTSGWSAPANSLLLRVRALGRGKHLPDLWVQPVFLEQFEGIVMYTPKGEVLKPVPFVLEDLARMSAHARFFANRMPRDAVRVP